MLYNGSIAPGRFRGRDVTIQDVFEAVGAAAAGKIDRRRLHELEGVACPGAGACGGQFTANTMAMALEFLGISPAGLNDVPATDPAKDEAAYETRPLVDAARPRRHSPVAHRDARGARERRRCRRGYRRLDERRPASARDRARARHRPDDRRVRRRSPNALRSSRDIKPGGRFVATDLHAAGGVALVARELLKAGLVHGDAPNVDGRTLAEVATAVVETPGQEVVVPIETPLKPHRRSRRFCAATSHRTAAS